MSNLHDFIPEYTFEILKNEFEKGKGPVFIEDFNQAIICNLRRMSLDDISNIMDVNEGLENKIKKAAIGSVSIEELISNIKSKRYAETRIRRILAHSLLGLYKKDLSFFKNDGGPRYIRVLGFSPKGRKLISMMKSSCPLPIITNVGDYRKYSDESLKRMIELDIQSTDIYVTSYLNKNLRLGGCDYYNKPIII